MKARERATLHVAVGTAAFAAITVMYWFSADPPTPWIFAITGAGVLFGIGVTMYRYRAGHFG